MVLGYIFSYGYVLLVLLLAVLAEKFKLLNDEGRRKLVHVLLIFTWIIMLRFLQGSIHMVIIPATFVVLNYFSYLSAKKSDGREIPILSSMERSGDEETPGTVYYALSIMILCGVTLVKEDMIVPCGIGLFCMAFGDGLAGVFGKRMTGFLAKRLIGDKSLGGSLACIIFSILGCELLLLLTGQDLMPMKIAVIGVICALLELPGNGLDNLTVPFGCALAASILI